MEEKTFWLDNITGTCQGGYFFRSDLFEFLKRLEKAGIKPVGIRVKDGYDLEVICVEPEKEIESVP